MDISPIDIVMNALMSDVELNRKQALLTLIEQANKWDKQCYELNDFCLDKCLREILKLPEKSLGKPPYEWLEQLPYLPN